MTKRTTRRTLNKVDRSMVERHLSTMDKDELQILIFITADRLNQTSERNMRAMYQLTIDVAQAQLAAR